MMVSGCPVVEAENAMLTDLDGLRYAERRRRYWTPGLSDDGGLRDGRLRGGNDTAAKLAFSAGVS